jgi:hypothetical protein
LDEVFPISALQEGRIVTHDELESAIGVERQTSRYYGVLRAWATRQRNANNVILEWQPTLGLKVLPPAEILHSAETRTRRKIKQTRQAIQRFGWVDRNRLDEIGQKRLDHQVRVAAVLGKALESAKRESAIELAPVVSLPKRAIAG